MTAAWEGDADCLVCVMLDSCYVSTPLKAPQRLMSHRSVNQGRECRWVHDLVRDPDCPRDVLMVAATWDHWHHHLVQSPLFPLALADADFQRGLASTLGQWMTAEWHAADEGHPGTRAVEEAFRADLGHPPGTPINWGELHALGGSAGIAALSRSLQAVARHYGLHTPVADYLGITTPETP